MANTSSISSFYMPLCLIFLSSHACNARPFAHLLIPTNLQQENKDNHDHLKDTSSVMLPSISKKVGQPAADHQNSSSSSSVIEDETKLAEADFMKFDSKADREDEEEDMNNKAEGGESSVVYHVPHYDKKREDKFNLDYAPPKTHPPVHN